MIIFLGTVLQCTIKQIAENFPVGLLTKEELLHLYAGIDVPSFLQNSPLFEMKSKLSNIPNLSDVDIENNIVNTIKSNYYEQDNFRHTTHNLKKSVLFYFISILEA